MVTLGPPFLEGQVHDGSPGCPRGCGTRLATPARRGLLRDFPWSCHGVATLGVTPPSLDERYLPPSEQATPGVAPVRPPEPLRAPSGGASPRPLPARRAA